MENDILDSLQDIGYTGTLLAEPELSKALDGGPKSPEYTKLVHIICDELKTLCGTEELVNCTQDADDASSFLLELSSFLKEIGCPYKAMVTGHMSSRLQTRADRILLLDYLLSELMAARMVHVDKPKDNKQMEIVVHETPTAKDLKDILLQLKFNKPPPNITPEVLFTKVLAKLNETIAKKGKELIGKPLYNKALNEKQWRELEVTYNEMFEEYQLRRETLITRLHCTIQSFEWSDRVKDKRDAVQNVYAPLKAKLSTKPAVKLSDFLAARDSLLLVEKTSSASVRKNTQSEVNKVIIGRVPDRGGRPSEQQPPPPEMPAWIKQRNQGAGFGGGFGGRGGGCGGRGDSRGGRGDSRGGRGDSRGGRVQGGWQRNDNQYSQGGRNQGGYNNRDSNQNPGSYNSQPSSNQYGGHQTYVTQSSQGAHQSYQPQSDGYRSQSQGYQASSQGYQTSSQGYQTQSKGYQTPSQGYQTQGYQSRQSYDSNRSSGYTTPDSGYSAQDRYSNSGRSGGYQNEHDDRMGGGRSNSDYAGQRGRSNYNRGGRY